MKREILFRGKRVDNGEFVYGSLVVMSNSCTYGGYDISSNMHIIEHEDIDTRAFRRGYETWVNNPLIQVISETVGQFTGLTDKNRVKIFEGDLCYTNNETYRIEMSRLAGAYRVVNIKDNDDNHFLLHTNNFIEVIGNIHDTND